MAVGRMIARLDRLSERARRLMRSSRNAITCVGRIYHMSIGHSLVFNASSAPDSTLGVVLWQHRALGKSETGNEGEGRRC